MAGHRKGTPGYFAQQERYRQTMIEKFGSDEARKEYYREIAAKGGRNGHTGGFASNPDKARVAGKKGGAISSRSKKKISLEARREKYKESIMDTILLIKDGYTVHKTIKNGRPHMYITEG